MIAAATLIASPACALLFDGDGFVGNETLDSSIATTDAPPGTNSARRWMRPTAF